MWRGKKRGTFGWGFLLEDVHCCWRKWKPNWRRSEMEEVTVEESVMCVCEW
jgi:hypothetical protein